LWGKVSEVHSGPINHEVTLTLPSGRSVTALISGKSCADMGLAPGVEACAFFKSSSVILAVYD
jgi:molybdate transport system regulatory protein